MTRGRGGGSPSGAGPDTRFPPGSAAAAWAAGPRRGNPGLEVHGRNRRFRPPRTGGLWALVASAKICTSICTHWGCEMTDRTVSIAEARANLPGLIREAEEGEAVQITRWGAPVAVLLSAARYQKLAQGRPSFGVALDRFLEGIELDEVGLEEGELHGLRDRGPGREAPW